MKTKGIRDDPDNDGLSHDRRDGQKAINERKDNMIQINLNPKRILAWVLAFALVFVMMPGYALADEGGDGGGSTLDMELSAVITDFLFINAIKVEIGTIETDIHFPSEVIANVQTDGDDAGASTVTVGVGAWQLAFGMYDPDVENRHVFEAVRDSLALPDDVTLPDDVELPCVAVDISEVEIGIAAMSSTTLSSGDTLTITADTDDETWNGSSGTATWSKANKTLTLNNFNFTTTAEQALSIKTVATIILVGDNSITSGDSTAPCAIYAQDTQSSELTIQGNGTLTVTAGNTASVNGTSYGMRAKLLTIKGSVNVTINAGSSSSDRSYGLSASGGLTIEETATVTANGDSGTYSYGVLVWSSAGTGTGTITISGGTLNAIGGTATTANSSFGINTNGTICVSGNGKITAKGNDFAIKGCSGEPSAGAAKGTTNGSTSPLQAVEWDGTDKTYEISTVAAKYMILAESGANLDAIALKNALIAAGAADVTVNDNTVTFSSGTATIAGSNMLTIPTGITLKIDGGTLDIKSSGNYGLWNEGTLNISGGTVNIESTGAGAGIYNCSTATACATTNISGGTVNIKNNNGSGIFNNSNSLDKRGQLSISSGAVNIENTASTSNGIVNNGDMAISGGTINAKNSDGTGIYNSAYSNDFLCGKITVSSGGTLTVENTGGTGIYNACNSTLFSTLEITGGTLAGSATGNIELAAGSKVKAPSGKFNDRGTSVTKTDEITVGAADATASAEGLSAGTYTWDGASSFKKANPEISSLTAGTTTIAAAGGTSVITIAGTSLEDGITVTAFDGSTATAVTGTTTGDATSQTVTLTFPANASTSVDKVYTIKASLDGGTTWDATDTAAVTVSKATVVPTTYTITFNANGGSVTPASSTTGADGKLSSLPTPTRSGSYSFNGWYTAASSGTQVTTSTVFAQNTTIYAQWTSTGGGGGGSTPTPTPTPAPDPTPTPPPSSVVVDGKEVDAGKVEVKENTTTVTVNQETIQTQLETAIDNVTVVVPAETGTAIAQLVVQNVDDMAAKEMTLTVQVGDVAYELPTTAIDTSTVLAALGAENAADVPISISINTDMSEAAKAAVNSAIEADGAALVIPPMEFKITATYEGRSVEIDTFSQYVSRSIEITAEQAGQITTAVVVDADGTTRQVPTRVYQKDGKWYAEINSLTNSTYAVIYNEIIFADAKGKWYEAAVNEMGSRKIISGIGDNQFAGERDITRAEFAAIIIRALGLPATGKGAVFADVSASDWYAGAVGTAYEYGLVTGVGDNYFAPARNITRQEAMLMIQRAAKLAGFKGSTGSIANFSDSDSVGDWALSAAKWNVGSGLIVGSGGKLNPTNNITRAETATLVLKLMQRAGLVDVRTKF